MDLAALNNDLEDLYRYVAQNPAGITTADMEREGVWDKQTFLTLANKLLQYGRLQMTTLEGTNILFQAVDMQTAAKFRGLGKEDMAVYQEIEKTGNKGAWTKVLKDQTQLQQHTITKVIKELLRRGLIKEVKSVQFKGRKVFMLSDVVPDKTVSGGTWYQDGEFAHTWIESLRAQCQQYLKENTVVSLKALHNYIQEQPGPSTPTMDDIQAIMRTLELDEVVHSISDATDVRYTLRNRAAPGKMFDVFAGRLPRFDQPQQASDADGLVVPCLLCPVQAECRVGGRISPEKCEYISRWLRDVGAGVNDVRMANDW